MSREEPTYSRQKSFLLQFRREADIGRGRLVGRIEHLASGQTLHFSSASELFAFVSQHLDPERRGDERDPTEPVDPELR